MVLHLLQKKLLILRYSLLWLFAGLVMLIMAIFPGILDFIASVTGIYTPTNALFALLIFRIMCILISITSIVSKFKDQNRRLVQQLALLEARVRRLENDSAAPGDDGK